MPTAASPTRFGSYELLEAIARGGMGVVYRVRQAGLNRIVALKMILAGQFASKQEVLRFRSEAEAAAALLHPNIVSIHETGERDGQHYCSMDFVQGRTLAQIVRAGPLPAQRAARTDFREVEQARAGERCIWNRGLLYHLLTGRPPFQAETIEEVLLLLRDADPVSPPCC